MKCFSLIDVDVGIKSKKKIVPVCKRIYFVPKSTTNNWREINKNVCETESH